MGCSENYKAKNKEKNGLLWFNVVLLLQSGHVWTSVPPERMSFKWPQGLPLCWLSTGTETTRDALHPIIHPIYIPCMMLIPIHSCQDFSIQSTKQTPHLPTFSASACSRHLRPMTPQRLRQRQGEPGSRHRRTSLGMS